MTRRWPLRRTTRVGIALAADRLVAVLPGDAPTAPWTRPLTPTGDPAVTWPDLADALGRLRETIGGAPFRGVLHVALLPPLAQLRRVELPGLSSSEARQVLRREPSRYLPLADDASAVELEIEGEGWRRASPFTLFAAPRALIDGIHAAAEATGWRVAEIVPAESAWAAGASTLLARANGGGRALVVCFDDRVEVVRVKDDRVATIRRVPVETPDLPSLALALAGNGDGEGSRRTGVAVIGDSPAAEELRAALGTPAVAPRAAKGDGALQLSPALLAARFAPRADGPALLPEAARLTVEHRGARATKLRFAAAAALLLAAAGLQLAGTGRERARIAAERDRLREPVARAMATRDSLEQVAGQLALLRSTAASAPRWSALIASLSSELPDDAYLISLRADNDTLHLEGSAARASGVFDALARVRGVRMVRPEGPIRQEVSADGVASEHFTVSAPLGRQP